MIHRIWGSFCIMQWEPDAPLRSAQSSLAWARGSASTFQGPSPTSGPKPSSPVQMVLIYSNGPWYATGPPQVCGPWAKSIHASIPLPWKSHYDLLENDAKIQKSATWELLSSHLLYQFRFFAMREGENPTQGGSREFTVRRKWKVRGYGWL